MPRLKVITRKMVLDLHKVSYSCTKCLIMSNAVRFIQNVLIISGVGEGGRGQLQFITFICPKLTWLPHIFLHSCKKKPNKQKQKKQIKKTMGLSISPTTPFF